MSYHAEINHVKERLEDKLPYVSEEGANKIYRTLQELSDMQKWIDPEKQLITPQVIEQRRVETRKKLHDVMDFIRGK